MRSSVSSEKSVSSSLLSSSLLASTWMRNTEDIINSIRKDIASLLVINNSKPSILFEGLNVLFSFVVITKQRLYFYLISETIGLSKSQFCTIIFLKSYCFYTSANITLSNNDTAFGQYCKPRNIYTK